MLDHARAWAARGFKVFPLRQGTNEVFKGFDWLNQATTDPQKLLDWWGRGQESNIGVLTDDMIVIDVDMKNGKNGLASLEALDLPTDTLTVKTPSGGYHKYFKGPSSRCSVGKLGEGLDIRSYHGYVVAPGSRTPKGEYQLVQDAPMLVAPAHLVAKLDRPRAKIDAAPLVELDLPTAIDRASAYLSREAPTPTTGSRNDALFKIACHLKDEGVSEKAATDLIELFWNTRLGEPLEKAEMEKTIGSAYVNGNLPAGVAAPEAHYSGVDVSQFDAPAPKVQMPFPGLTALLQPRSLRPLADMRRRPWVLRRMLLRGFVTTIVAPGSAGKSLLQLTIAAHLAVGAGFAGYDPEEPGVPVRSLVFNQEDDRDEMEKRLRAVCIANMLDPDLVAERVTLLPFTEYRFKVADGDKVDSRAADLRAIAKACREQDVRVVFIDPFLLTHDKDINDNSGIYQVMSLYSTFAQDAGAAVMLSHHTSKGQPGKSRAGDADAGMGAAAVINGSRVALTLYAATDDDCETFKIPQQQRRWFVRLDDAKANFGVASGEPVWLERKNIDLTYGDGSTEGVGSLVVADLKAVVQDERAKIAGLLQDAFAAQHITSALVGSCIKWVRSADAMLDKKPDVALRRLIIDSFKQPFKLSDGVRVWHEAKKATGEKVAADWIFIE